MIAHPFMRINILFLCAARIGAEFLALGGEAAKKQEKFLDGMGKIFYNYQSYGHF